MRWALSTIPIMLCFTTRRRISVAVRIGLRSEDLVSAISPSQDVARTCLRPPKPPGTAAHHFSARVWVALLPAYPPAARQKLALVQLTPFR